MTDRERYQRAFNTLHASREIQLEVPMKQWNMKKAAILAACILALFTAGVSAYASTNSYWGWGNNLEVVLNEFGEGESCLYTEDLTEPVILKDGRMFFIVNGEYTDITDEVSVDRAYIYRYTDAQDCEHLWLVGLNSDALENFGYAEFLFQDGHMIGGYSARLNMEADGTSKPWFDLNRPY